jgi:hypothetical protein
MLGATPGYSYRNKVASTIEARRTGANFSSLPGAYFPGPKQVVRGGMFPRTTDLEAGTFSVGSVVTNEQQLPKPVSRAGLGKKG